jgi:hypothetical protein
MMAGDLEKELDEDKYEKYKEKVGKVWDKIKNYRKNGLEEEGEFSMVI